MKVASRLGGSTNPAIFLAKFLCNHPQNLPLSKLIRARDWRSLNELVTVRL